MVMEGDGILTDPLCINCEVCCHRLGKIIGLGALAVGCPLYEAEPLIILLQPGAGIRLRNGQLIAHRDMKDHIVGIVMIGLRRITVPHEHYFDAGSPFGIQREALGNRSGEIIGLRAG